MRPRRRRPRVDCLPRPPTQPDAPALLSTMPPPPRRDARRVAAGGRGGARPPSPAHPAPPCLSPALPPRWNARRGDGPSRMLVGDAAPPCRPVGGNSPAPRSQSITVLWGEGSTGRRRGGGGVGAATRWAHSEVGGGEVYIMTLREAAAAGAAARTHPQPRRDGCSAVAAAAVVVALPLWSAAPSPRRWSCPSVVNGARRSPRPLPANRRYSPSFPLPLPVSPHSAVAADLPADDMDVAPSSTLWLHGGGAAVLVVTLFGCRERLPPGAVSNARRHGAAHILCRTTM